MLPKSKDGPPELTQEVICFVISRVIYFDLCAPVVPISCRLLIVRWASVPEAAVNVYCNFRFPEHNVRCSAYCFFWSLADAIPQSLPVQEWANPKFRLRVPALVALHRFACSFIGSPRTFRCCPFFLIFLFGFTHKCFHIPLRVQPFYDETFKLFSGMRMQLCLS